MNVICLKYFKIVCCEVFVVVEYVYFYENQVKFLDNGVYGNEKHLETSQQTIKHDDSLKVFRVLTETDLKNHEIRSSSPKPRYPLDPRSAMGPALNANIFHDHDFRPRSLRCNRPNRFTVFFALLISHPSIHPSHIGLG